MKFFRTVILFLSVILSGCIGEDRDNCPPADNLILRFCYVIDGGNDIFLQRVEKTNLFIFDVNGYFVRQQTIGKNSLDAGQSFSLSLSPGTYRIVCWGNMLERTDVFPLDANTHFEGAFIYNTTLQSGNAAGCDPLYYATGSLADYSTGYYFTVPRTGTITRTLDFTCAYIKLEAFIEGFTDPDGAGGNLPPVVEIEALEAKWNFSMHPFGSTYNYVLQSAYQNIQGTDFATAYFNLPPFKDDNSLKLHIKRASDGFTVTSVILKDYMAANGLTVENIEEAVVPIHISYGSIQNVDVTISLPAWGESPVNPEL